MKLKDGEVKKEKQPVVMTMMILMVMRMAMKVVMMVNMMMPIDYDYSDDSGEATKA